jgi:hypothetical protein
MRTSKPLLETVINAGVRTLIYDGDADYVFNFKGVEAMVDHILSNLACIVADVYLLWCVRSIACRQSSLNSTANNRSLTTP